MQRSRCQAVFWGTARSAASWTEDLPLEFAAVRNIASSHVCSPSLEPCITVWGLTEKCLRQLLYRYGIGLRVFTTAALVDSQCGHTGPSGQKLDTNYRSAAAPSGKSLKNSTAHPNHQTNPPPPTSPSANIIRAGSRLMVLLFVGVGWFGVVDVLGLRGLRVLLGNRAVFPAPLYRRQAKIP